MVGFLPPSQGPKASLISTFLVLHSVSMFVGSCGLLSLCRASSIQDERSRRVGPVSSGLWVPPALTPQARDGVEVEKAERAD